MHCPAGGETVNFYFVECGFRRLFRSFSVIEPFNRRKWVVIHVPPNIGTTHSWRINVFLFHDNKMFMYAVSLCGKINDNGA